MPEEEVVNENESGENTGEESGSESGENSGNESETGTGTGTGTGIDIASQSGQQAIADAIEQVFHNVNIYLHNTKVEESEANAAESESNAAESESNAADSATLAESYCKGGTNTRSGEDTDNAKYYYEQITSLITNFPSTDGDYVLSRSEGVLGWESILDGDGGSY